MRVSDILDRKGAFVATIAPEAHVKEVVGELCRHRIGALVVSKDGKTIDGIVSERDVVRALDAYGAAMLDGAVRGIMSKEVRTCTPDDDVESLVVMMTEHRIRHVPVVRDGALVGIASIGDVVKSRMDELVHDRDELVHYISAR